MKIAMLALATLTTGWFASLLSPAVGSDPLSKQCTASELLGEQRDAVLERLGPPSSIGFSQSWFTFSYPSLDGREVTIAMNDRVVFFVDSADAELAPVEPRPATGSYLGQPVAEMVKRLGPPASFSGSSSPCLMLKWGNGTEIWVADGIVAWIRSE